MRRGVPIAGNFLQQELAIVTGAVEAMLVDVQCVMPGARPRWPAASTPRSSPRRPRPSSRARSRSSSSRTGRRRRPARSSAGRSRTSPAATSRGSQIPDHKMDVVAGFTTESITHMLGGTYRGGFRPLNDGIIAGRIRGVVGVVGCDSPKQIQDQGHLDTRLRAAHATTCWWPRPAARPSPAARRACSGPRRPSSMPGTGCGRSARRSASRRCSTWARASTTAGS